MKNIFLQIDTSSEQAKILLEYLKKLDFIRVVEDKEKIPLIQQIAIGLNDVKKGNTQSMGDLIKELQDEQG